MRFPTSRRTASRGRVLVAGALSLSACSAGSLGSDDEQLEADRDHVPDQQRPEQHRDRRGGHRGVRGGQPGHRGQAGHPPGRRRGRQPGQDPAVDRRHGRRLRVQLRVAVPGDRARRRTWCPSPTSPGSPTWTRRSSRSSAPATTSTASPWRHHHRRRHLLQHPGLRGARPRGPHDLGRVHGQQREDQGRPASPRSSRPSATPGPRRSSCSPTTTTSQAANPTFAEEYTEQRGEVRHDPGGPGRLPAPAGGPRGGLPQRGLRLRQVHRRPRPRWPPARRPTTRCSPSASPAIARRRPGQRRRRRASSPCRATTPPRTAPTLWSPSGIYIPKTTEGDKLEAAKKFQAFVASPEGCEAQASAAPVGGPFAVTTCELPGRRRRPRSSDLTPTSRRATSTPALEFLSPIKGPALEQITVEVGLRASGRRTDGAALYDQDVEKQAQQLGLEGW